MGVTNHATAVSRIPIVAKASESSSGGTPQAPIVCHSASSGLRMIRAVRRWATEAPWTMTQLAAVRRCAFSKWSGCARIVRTPGQQLEPVELGDEVVDQQPRHRTRVRIVVRGVLRLGGWLVVDRGSAGPSHGVIMANGGGWRLAASIIIRDRNEK